MEKVVNFLAIAVLTLFVIGIMAVIINESAKHPYRDQVIWICAGKDTLTIKNGDIDSMQPLESQKNFFQKTGITAISISTK